MSLPRLLSSCGFVLLAPLLSHAQAVKLNGPLAAPGSGDVLSARFSADGARAVYLAARYVGGNTLHELYSVPVGGGSTVMLNAPLPAQGGVADFTLAAGGRVVYRAEQDSASALELYTVPVDGSAAPVKLHAPLGAGGQVHEFLVTPDGTRVVWLASQVSGQPRRLFGAPSDGSAAAVALDGALTPAFAVSASVPRFLLAGARVLFMVDALGNGRRELFSAPIDGSAAPVQITGPIFANAEQQPYFLNPFEFCVSSDGARVVYRSDQAAPGTVELYTVPVDGSAASARLNTPLSAGQDLLTPFEITPDGATVVYVHGDLQRVPIDASAAPTAVVSAAPDAIEQILISPSGARVVYKRWSEDGEGRLYSVPLAGGTGVPISSAGEQPGDFEIGLGGTRVLYESSLEGSSLITIYSTPIGGGAAPIALNGTLLPYTNFYYGIPMQLAPDGIGVIFPATTAPGEPVELYGVPIYGGSAPIKLCDTQTTLSDLRAFAVAPSSFDVLYLADQDTDEVIDLYRRPVGSSAPALKLTAFPPGPTVGDVSWSAIAPDGAHVVYLANQDLSTQLELYSVSLATGGPPVKLNLPLPEGGNVELNLHYGVAPVITLDGNRVVFVARRPDGADSALYSAPIDGSGPVLELAPGKAPRSSPLLLTSVGGEVVFQGWDGATRLLRVPVDGSGPATVIDSVPSVGAYRLDPASTRLVYLRPSNFGYRLFSVPLDGSGNEVMLSPAFVVSASVQDDFLISSDGSRVVFRSPAGTNAGLELYSAPIDGSAPAVKLNGPISGRGLVWQFEISSDGSRVVYCTDQEVADRYELYAVPTAGGVPLKLNQSPGGVTNGHFKISPDGERVVYGNVGLYSVPIDRSTEPLLISQTFGTNNSARDFAFIPGRQALVFRTELGNLFRVPIAGGPAPRLLNDPAFLLRALDTGFRITPDGEWVLYHTQSSVGGRLDLRAAPTLPGTADRLLVNGTLPQNSSVQEYAVSPDGSFAVYRADQEAYGVFELYLGELPDTRQRVDPTTSKPLGDQARSR